MVWIGNKGLCGQPLNECIIPKKPAPAATTPNIPTSKTKGESADKKPSPKNIIVVAIVLAVAIAAIIAAAFILLRRRKQTPDSIEAPPPSKVQKKKESNQGQAGSSSEHLVNGKKKVEIAAPKLCFIREDGKRFDLHDLLKASAEILGSGCFGLSYKAALSSGIVVVVKRFKQMNSVGKEEFHEHMRRLGRLSHPNLLPLVAYYYRKEEKLMVTDHIAKGSLAAYLHGMLIIYFLTIMNSKYNI